MSSLSNLHLHSSGKDNCFLTWISGSPCRTEKAFAGTHPLSLSLCLSKRKWFGWGERERGNSGGGGANERRTEGRYFAAMGTFASFGLLRARESRHLVCQARYCLLAKYASGPPVELQIWNVRPSLVCYPNIGLSSICTFK